MNKKCECGCRELINSLSQTMDKEIADLQSSKEELVKLLEENRRLHSLTDKDIDRIRGTESQRDIISELKSLRRATQNETQGLRQSVVELMA